MSSRALRKLQKEQELEKQLAVARAAEDDEDSGDEEVVATSSKPRNAFDMLEHIDADESDREGEAQYFNPKSQAEEELETPLDGRPTSKSKKKKKKSKKAREKSSAQAQTPSGASIADPSMDEIDRALKELTAKNGETSIGESMTAGETLNSWEADATRLLSIDSRNLNPLNEMRSLFGNIALEESSDSRSNSRNQRRREQDQQGGVDLATALTGRHSTASKGKELGALAARRNIFMQGKEEWPLATSGGLSMEYTPSGTFEKRYTIRHNNAYRETQWAFRQCVESMEPSNMITLLTLHPYHIATLLQVSEIAKHQGDHSVCGDLLERALFTFGRSVHSTFPAAFRDGCARVSFDKPANRELYLTMWRYIRNLEQRGTWRTAFEWAKALLQLNTTSDPYGVTLMIDQFALRARQHAALIDMASTEAYGITWAHLPNIKISLALAFHRASQPKLARQALAVAMHQYPYILSALASALDISPLPKFLWAKLPSTDAEKLYTDLYVMRAKDLWNTPETTSLLVEIASTLNDYNSDISAATPAAQLEVSLEEARHIMLLDVPALIALLPRKFTNLHTSSSDILPPPDTQSDESSFSFRAPGSPGSISGLSTLGALINAAGSPIAGVNGMLNRIMNWFHVPAEQDEARNEQGETDGQAAFRELGEQLDLLPEEVEDLVRMQLLEGDQEDHAPRPLTAEQAATLLSITNRVNTNFSSDSEEDNDVAALSAANPQRHPRAAHVDDDDEDSDDASNGPRTAAAVRRANRPILRHVDSDSDEDMDDGNNNTHPAPTATIWTPIPTAAAAAAAANYLSPSSSAQPPPAPSPPPPPPAASSSTTATGLALPDASDPQRVQRWLVSGGLAALQQQEGDDHAADYVRLLTTLRPAQQDWILQIVRQRAGAAVETRLRERLAR